MTVYACHVFDRSCDAIVTHHFQVPHHTLTQQDLSKLIFGVIFSLRSTIRKLSSSSSSDASDADAFFSFKTSHYALHVLESPTLLRFTLMTSPDVSPVTAEGILRQVYRGLWVEYILKNPLSLPDLYSGAQVRTIEEARFGARDSQTAAMKRRQDQITARERASGAGPGVAMVVGCELFTLALEQFILGLPV